MEPVAKLVHLKATVRQIYGGRSLLVGDPFPEPVPENVAAGLIRNNYACIDKDKQDRERLKYQTRSLTPEPDAPSAQAAESSAEGTPSTDDAESAARPKGRRYNRRDLRVDDEGTDGA